MMIPQCKGKDLIKIPKSKLGNSFMMSCKYDGNYVQIHKIGNNVKFYTSGNKEFYLIDLADKLIKNNDSDFIIECEYIADTDGKMGSRGKCTTTTFRTLFKKGLPAYLNTGIFKMFNVIAYKSYYEHTELENIKTFGEAIATMRYINIANTNIYRVKFRGPYTLDRCKELNKGSIKSGYEGDMLVDPKAEYLPGKRVNGWIKLKDKPTADLKCFGVLPGELDSKYEDMIGSLQLVDEQGITVCVGSGLSDTDRHRPIDYFVGKIIEVQYESFKDTYIQPVYKGVRHDK